MPVCLCLWANLLYYSCYNSAILNLKKKKHFNHNSILKRLQLNKRKKKTSCQLVKKVYLGSCSNGVHTTRQFRIHSPHVYLMSYLAGILKHIHTYIHFHNKVISIILDRKGYICYVMSRSAKWCEAFSAIRHPHVQIT